MASDSTDRLVREASFQDQRIHDDSARASTGKFYATVANAHEKWLADVEHACEARAGGRILEVGCSSGELARQLESRGVTPTGIDISQGALVEAMRRRNPSIGASSFARMDAHHLGFNDNCFDVIYGRGVLHHLDTDILAAELARVLAPGGIAVFQEPMGHNILINSYRRFTPGMRSPDEHPLLMDDIDRYAEALGAPEITWFGGTSLAMAPFQKHRRAKEWTKALMRADQWIFGRVPVAGRFAWIANLVFRG